MSSKPPRTPAVPAAARPNRPKNCRRETFVAVRSASALILSSMGHLLKIVFFLTLRNRDDLFRLLILGLVPVVLATVRFRFIMLLVLSGPAEDVAEVLPGAGDPL